VGKPCVQLLWSSEANLKRGEQRVARDNNDTRGGVESLEEGQGVKPSPLEERIRLEGEKVAAWE